MFVKHSPKKSLTGIVVLILLSFIIVSCGNKRSDTPANTNSKPLPKLLDLGADKCIPCKEMEPVLEELKKDYVGVLEVEFIDVWKPENQQEAVKYGIRSIPTQIFFAPDGKELWRHTGFISKADILQKWEELGYPLKSRTNSAAIEEDCADCTSCGETEEERICE